MLAPLLAITAAGAFWTPSVPPGHSEPAWSRGRLAVVAAKSSRDGIPLSSQIAVLKGQKLRAVTRRGINIGPAWSPDGMTRLRPLTAAAAKTRV